jgi:hypothetical protein
MLLYTNGCSFSIVGEPRVWCNRVAEKLSWDLLNEAMGGGSNDRINRKTIKFLVDNKDNLDDIFVAIQITWPHRMEGPSSEINHNPGEQHSKYWCIPLSTTKGLHPYFLNENSDLFYLQKSKDIIINLHRNLCSYNVKHLFFFAPETSLLIDSFSKEELNYLDKENFVLDDTLIEYQKRLNCNYINKQGEVDGHPGYKSQNGWGDKIYNIIKERFDL